MPINKVKRLKADPVTAVFVIKDVKKNRKTRPKYLGLGELFDKVKKAEPALNSDELKKVNVVDMLFPTHEDISENVTLVTPSKLNIGPGHSKKLAESQKKMLEQTPTVPSNDTLSIDIDSPIPKKKPAKANKEKGTKSQSVKNKPKKTNEKKGVKGNSKGQNRKDKLPQMSEIELMDGIELITQQTEVEEVGNKDDFSDASPNRPRMSSYEQMRMDSLEKNRKFLSGLAFHHKPQESRMPEYIVQGIWVIVAFEENWYPGLVKHINEDKDSITIKFMQPSGKNKFKWPAKEDRIDIERKFVIFVCLLPYACTEGENLYVLPGTDCIKIYILHFRTNILLNRWEAVLFEYKVLNVGPIAVNAILASISLNGVFNKP